MSPLPFLTASLFGCCERGRKPHEARARLVLEPLEQRDLLALMFDPAFTSLNQPNGHVFVNHNGEMRAMAMQSDGKLVLGGGTFVGAITRDFLWFE
jgi:hypothetical protein